MKKFLHLASVFATLLTLLAGCTESAEVEDMITATPLRISSSAAGDEKTITIQSKCDWTAVCDAEWVTLLMTRGDAGKNELKIKVLPNAATEARTAQIRIGNEQYNVQCKIAVTQEKNEFINIPDAGFRSYLLDNFDSDCDGQLSKAECEAIDTIYPWIDKNIASLQGIEYFTALKFLGCHATEITKLDVSKNTKLVFLNCNGNLITSLDVTKNPNLKELYCWGTQITSLNVSKNTKLEDLTCHSTEITKIDVSKNSNLEELICDNTKITSLDVSSNPNLLTLYCFDNPQLKTIYLKTGQNIKTFEKDNTAQIVYK